MLGQIDVMVMQVTQEMTHNWGWFLAFGIALMLLGIAAVIRSISATVASMMFFGWLMLFASIIDLVSAFMVGKWAGFFLHLALAVLLGITGVILIKHPMISAEVATLVMSMFFLIAGLYQLVVRILDSPAGLWLACPERSRHLPSGRSAPGAMAALRTLCDWTFRGD